MFGDGFFKNTAFLFTRWSMSKKDIITRKKQSDTEEKKQGQFNDLLRETDLFNTKEFTLPCFYIDNSLNDKETFECATEEEKVYFVEAINGIKNWLSQLPPFECKDMQKVELERQRLEREK